MEWNILNKSFVINGNDFDDLEGFYQQISELLIPNEDWQIGTLDGLNDVLYGGFGSFDGFENILFVWENHLKSKNDLSADATIKWYKNKLDFGEMFDAKSIEKKLTELENGEGQTLYEIILEIFSEHKKIQLLLK